MSIAELETLSNLLSKFMIEHSNKTTEQVVAVRRTVQRFIGAEKGRARKDDAFFAAVAG